VTRPVIIVSAGPGFDPKDYLTLHQKGDLCVLNYAHKGLADNPELPVPKYFCCCDTAMNFKNDWYPNPNVIKLFAKKPDKRLDLKNERVTICQQSTAWDEDYFETTNKKGDPIPKRILYPFKTILFAVQYLHLFEGYQRLAFYGSPMTPNKYTDFSKYQQPWYGNAEDYKPELRRYMGKCKNMDTMLYVLRQQSWYLKKHNYQWTSLTKDSALNEFMHYSRIDLYD